MVAPLEKLVLCSCIEIFRHIRHRHWAIACIAVFDRINISERIIFERGWNDEGKDGGVSKIEYYQEG